MSRCIGIVFMLLALATSARGQIDSTQWPLPKQLGLLPCHLSGIYSMTISSRNGGYDTSMHITKYLPEWITCYSCLGITSLDLVSHDSNTLHCLRTDTLTTTLSLDIKLDTSKHRIISLHIKYSGGLSSMHEDLDYTLVDLLYSRAEIKFSDNDLWRHLVSSSYQFRSANSNQQQTTSFCCPDGFSGIGGSLTPGLSFSNQINFGKIQQDSARDTTISFQNLSDSAIVIQKFSLQNPDNAFGFIDTSLHRIPAGTKGSIKVRFHPHKTWASSGSITVTTDELYAPSLRIQLSGTAAASSVASELYHTDLFAITPSVATERIDINHPVKGSLSIYNTLGQNIFLVQEVRNGNTSIDTHSWPDGTYFAVCSSEGQLLRSKFVVKH